MLHKTPAIAFLLFAAWGGLTSLNPSNPPTGRTGAPGESTCAASGCHSGGQFTGTVSLSGLPDTVQPSQTYMITLTHMSNAVRAGFQLTALDSVNAKAGNLTGGAGMNVASAAGRQYIRQSTPKNLSGGSTSWTFSWTAPAATTKDPITFYFASLAANGNGSNSGDNPLLGSKTVALAATTSGVDPLTLSTRIEIFPNPASERLHITVPGAGAFTARLYDREGRLVQEQQSATSTAVFDVHALPAGVYTAMVESAGKTESRQWIKE